MTIPVFWLLTASKNFCFDVCWKISYIVTLGRTGSVTLALMFLPEMIFLIAASVSSSSCTNIRLPVPSAILVSEMCGSGMIFTLSFQISYFNLMSLLPPSLKMYLVLGTCFLAYLNLFSIFSHLVEALQAAELLPDALLGENAVVSSPLETPVLFWILCHCLFRY